MPLIISRKTTDSKIAQSIEMGVSQSEFGTHDLCHYRWYLEKVEMLTSVKPEFVLTSGTSFHEGMDWMYRTNGQKIGVPPLKFNKLAKLTPEEELEAIYWHKILWILIKAYRVYYKDDFTGGLKIKHLEQVLRVNYEGITLCGATDLVVERNNAAEMWDHKTKGMKSAKSSATDEWKTRFQFFLYTFMWNQLNPDDRIRTFMANVIMKPAISRKNNESMEGFFQRLTADLIKRRADYFKRERIQMTPMLMTAWHDNFLRPYLATFRELQKVKEGSDAWEALVLKKNSSSCWAYGRQCAFYAHCHSGAKLENISHLTKRKAKHEHYEEKAD